MSPTTRRSLPEVDGSFLETFMPYELRLAQRRTMLWERAPEEVPPSAFLGLFLLRMDAPPGIARPAPDAGGRRIAAHLSEIVREVVRDSDIPVALDDVEHLALLRDLDPQQAYVVAQRLLTLAGTSTVLHHFSLIPRIGFVVYPLSPRPDLDPNDWRTLLTLARRLCDRSETGGPASGFGLYPGPRALDARIPESDLIPLVFEDAQSLVKAGAIQMQRIHVLPKT